jgi:hypothetical protein
LQTFPLALHKDEASSLRASLTFLRIRHHAAIKIQRMNHFFYNILYLAGPVFAMKYSLVKAIET